VSYWLYPGSRAAYSALLGIRPFLDLLEKNKTLSSFEVGYTFPSIAYKEMYRDDSQIGEVLKNVCYDKGRHCSIGLIDSRPFSPS
jgi:hypothetical protein